jgi:hypothetical protein
VDYTYEVFRTRAGSADSSPQTGEHRSNRAVDRVDVSMADRGMDLLDDLRSRRGPR